MNIDKEQMQGIACLVVAVGLLSFGAWQRTLPDAPAEIETAPEASLAELAAAVDAEAPKPSGAAIIIGADYDGDANTFVMDMKPDPAIFDHAPLEMFFVAAGDMLSCEKQTPAMIEMTRDTDVLFRLFDGDGIVRATHRLPRGSCTTIPVDATRRQTGVGFQPG